ncbi:DEAD/DEAH box helicase [Bacillus sp. YIM B13449]|uniref:DEAD/DEAH box helicase n=1 Tax=Bacillus sp. YIM B13449 TaxID=3366882 RepID=UPI003B81B4F2
MYKTIEQIIPNNQRKQINEKILYLIENNKCEEMQITKEDIFNSYTGEGGLHGLSFSSFVSYHEYSEAKKEIENGQFFTPHKLSRFLMECLKPTEKDLIADLTCGMGNFFNYCPNQENVYGNELDIKAFKVARHLYPNANLSNEDIRFYNSDIKFDFILGNPPFNLRWKVNNNEILSQLFYVQKASELMKPGGILALIVPNSFLNDDFYTGMINQVNDSFNFICQFALPTNAFKQMGVDHYETKVMIFQNKSEHLPSVPYEINYTEMKGLDSQFIYENFVHPALQQKEQVRHKIRSELAELHESKKGFLDKVNKLLFDIKRHPAISHKAAKCEQYVERYFTQSKPHEMAVEEWNKKKLTEKKVLSYLKRVLKEQHGKPKDKRTALVKTRYGLKMKAYSHKEKRLLNMQKGTKSADFSDLLRDGYYPFQDKRFLKLFLKKQKDHAKAQMKLSEIEPTEQITSFLDQLEIHDSENQNVIKLNDIQKTDTGKLLMKDHAYLQWGTGSGKSISAIAQIMYRQQHSNIKNVFIVAPAIAINNNWHDILISYGFNVKQIKSMKDIETIEQGQIVIMTFNMLTKYERFIKRYIKKQSQKVMLVLDEADNISNPSSKRTKAVLNCFRRVKYKVLLSATSTRNNVSEAFTAFELMYNNSVNFLCKCETLYEEDRKTKQLGQKENKHYNKPFPAYKKGHRLFKQCFSPEKVTVFGIGKHDQSIYNSDHLKSLIDRSMITRTFEEVAGKAIYEIKQNFCQFNLSEKDLYSTIMKEFYRMTNLYKSTGNTRKDSLLMIINQLNSLLKACVLPNSFKEHSANVMPSKAIETINLLKEWQHDKVAIGCTHVEAVNRYASYIKDHFPDRPVFVITGDKASFEQRKQIVKNLKSTENGILICTQQSLPSSMNIDFVNRVLLLEMQWNFSAMQQFFGRFVRYTSTDQKEIHFLTVENSIESNMLQLVMSKEKINCFMKNEDLDSSEINERFGLDGDILDMLLTKEQDKDGKTYIAWGDQKFSKCS